MSFHRPLLLARSILVGWAVLLIAGYLIERPLLGWTARALGSHWFPTVHISLDCLTLAAAGWVIGRFHRDSAILGALAFAATLSLWDQEPLLALNVPWLIQLGADALRDSVYVSSFARTAVEHALLFGSLLAGAFLSRPARPPASIFGGKAE
jgi:hypothetical protein